ncbi:tripartite-type tricarboxylate transporter receptor subunit TctC [Bradyrhizobium sp. AZCC 1610]
MVPPPKKDRFKINCSNGFSRKGKSTKSLEKSLEHYLLVEEAPADAKAGSGGKLNVENTEDQSAGAQYLMVAGGSPKLNVANTLLQ